jgi:hypothetical protein
VRARLAARFTDALAKQYLAGVRENPRGARAQLAAMRLPDRLQVREPEGYAYYGLEPRSYAASVQRAGLDGTAFAVVGIRSIGTSLSAVVLGALRRRGAEAERITVRPSGHPWARELRLDEALYAWVRHGSARNAQFVIVDEGPGLSGSTFLAVARALEAAGVPSTRITFLCSHLVNPERLASDEARLHWSRYRCLAPVAEPEAIEQGHDLSAGAWRHWVFGPNRKGWPVSWTQLERIKHLSDCRSWLDKFEGLPPYSQPALARAAVLADAGIAPAATYLGKGMVRFPWLIGRPAERSDLEQGGLDQLAKYCAFRARAFPAIHVDTTLLGSMLDVNVREEFGLELGGRLNLELETPVVPDARMRPHKWLVTQQGRYYKLDGHADGSGHLLPGPCDVCFDLAGAIVEWKMNVTQSSAFVSAFEKQTGDRVQRRLPNYLIAYCALQAGALSLAALSASADERPRIDHAHAEYRASLASLLRQRGLLQP